MSSEMSREGALLVLNSGSSSIKFTVFHVGKSGEEIAPLFAGQVTGIGTAAEFSVKDVDGNSLARESWAERDTGGVAPLLRDLIAWIRARLPDLPLLAAGHRVVHGGAGFHHPVRVTNHVLDELESLVPLAPLHQPQNVSAIRVLAESFDGLPQIACFDTAFHHSQPFMAKTYGLPRRFREKGVQRYGFHGLSYEYIAGKLRETLPEVAEGRVVVAHLGNGSSLCGLKDGRSIDTTMGFSALEGVPMGTRSGSLDPGILIYLMREMGMDADALEHLLYQESGLLGVSGISNDMRVLLESDRPEAKEAVDLFCYRVAKEIGALCCALGGLDALVFTAGIGEHSAPVRARICDYLAFLGISIDDAANESGETLISAPATLPVAIIPTNEEFMIARHAVDLMNFRNAA
ncbi:acetate/propionate family kinase [Afifella marina]|uniref:Acetate kinase n=1 Tax=Afifella marina DSM 2698 TaxID=1120955 RepID=A0A1G5MZU4_AFIMA|nr:acetate/propionate family kinase [Afifella marina]MBK1622168.1 acetate/propionate family kinase [Afifella marina DSM 2698]MBK1628293.1 acetate/propionate family kinase [Afifella marina]MBK5918952.1 acetate kinase [Afifella marina]RAI17809.1 acetate kinase [Afifella marina DSM 2698]SCZ30061.1 acetate kinase [Afifella marina DSM 2698]